MADAEECPNRSCLKAEPRLMDKESGARRRYKIIGLVLWIDVYAPLAQLVEHLTLNQGVQGSSP